jgi:hypothetical protein
LCPQDVRCPRLAPMLFHTAMWHSGPLEHLSRAARLELAEGVTFGEPAWLEMRRPAATPAPASATARKRYCLGCLSPIANGHPVCGDDDGPCGDLWWNVCPTKNGSLYRPQQPRG